VHEGKGERAFGQYATVMYGGVDVKFHVFLTSSFGAARPDCFTSGEGRTNKYA
jgi:hypothetical protein